MASDDTTQVGGSGHTLADRYELLDPIARGGMSTVFRAHDRSLDREVAVKLIDHDPAGRVELEHLRDRFRREAANAARIPPHPNVVQIYDYGTDPRTDRDFIVMERLRGNDLKSEMARRSFATAEAIEIVRQASQGLAAGHRAGIVHRDIKPANLLLAGDGHGWNVRILDFGISKALEGEGEEDLTLAGGVPHTPAHASPEQLRRSPAVGPASDVFQLGAVAYQLLTGEPPYTSEERDRIAGGEAVPLSGRGRWSELPERLRSTLERALSIDPSDRFENATAFGAALGSTEPSDSTAVLPADAAPGDRRTGGVAELDDRDETQLAPEPAAATTSPTSADHPPAETREPLAREPASLAETGRESAKAGAVRSRRAGFNPLLAGGGIVLVLVLAFLLLGRGSDSEEAGSADLDGAEVESVSADNGSVTETLSETEEIFAPLYREASEWLEEQDSAR